MKLKHANIVRCYDVFEPTPQDENAYIVMQLMHFTLAQVLDAMGKMTESEASFVINEIAKGVEYIHSKGIMHNDIKLDNVLVRTDRNRVIKEIKVADFGLSRTIQDNLIAGVHSGGTMSCAAPEMLTFGKMFNERIDTWAIGIILYNLFFDKQPFQSRDQRVMVKRIKNKEQDFELRKFQNLSMETAGLLDQLLQKKPTVRLTST